MSAVIKHTFHSQPEDVQVFEDRLIRKSNEYLSVKLHLFGELSSYMVMFAVKGITRKSIKEIIFNIDRLHNIANNALKKKFHHS